MRKVLSFVLVLALVLSSFSMAFAADSAAASLTDIAGIANEDAIQVCYDLGIVTGNPDGTFLPEKAVTRAEFAAMLTRALDIPASALAGYTATSFKDTAGYSWAVPYLAFCQSKGILLGDGAGNVMPGKTITVNEAMTMALRAIGYTANSALLVGAWPSNYVSIAQNNDLYDDVAATSTVDKASAAQIIYNLLTVQKVTVNSDGDTNALWIDEDDEDASNLLNTNLGCTEEDDVIIGVDFDYEDSSINITDMLGAYGTAYTNDDDDDKLVAFIPDSVALTGTVDGDTFTANDVDYDITGSDFSSAAAIFNTDVLNDEMTIDEADIASFAGIYPDDEETVTINVDLSSKKIKDIYSVVAWGDAEADLAASDVQTEISEDQELNNNVFVLDDDDAIDMASFSLVGVASLDAIAEDDVLYIYNDEAGKIRKVEVGTETVEGVVEETDDDTTATIGGKDYDLSALAVVEIPADIDVDSDGTFYLDVNGEIYDFDGTGTIGTYGVIKAYTAEDQYDNSKVRIYKSDDSSATLYFNDADDEIDWVSGTDTSASLTGGALIGYSLDANGDIEEIDNTVTSAASGVEFKSTKVLKVGSTSYSIDSDAVVFTYATSAAANFDLYDVAKLSEVSTGTITGTTYFILDDDSVVALFIENDNVDTDEDSVYGVFNTRKSVKDADDEAVYKLTGFIDGTAFTKLTDAQDNEFKVEGNNGVYKITVDANDVITAVEGLYADEWNDADTDSESGFVVLDAVIDSMNSDKTVITDMDGDKWTVADDAIVYKWDADDEEFTVSKLSSLRSGYTVSLYDTKGEDVDGVASVVIYIEN